MQDCVRFSQIWSHMKTKKFKATHVVSQFGVLYTLSLNWKFVHVVFQFGVLYMFSLNLKFCTCFLSIWSFVHVVYQFFELCVHII